MSSAAGKGEPFAPGTGEPESAKRRRTRAALVEAAHEVFAQHGLGGTTIDQLTRAAGFTRGAFYSNFASKEELMLAAMEREQEQVTVAMAQGVEDAGDEDAGDEGDDEESATTIEELTATLVEVLAIGSSNREWQLAVMEALPVSLRDPSLARRQLSIRAAAESLTRELVERGLERLERRASVELDLLVRLLLGLVDRLRTDVLLEDDLAAFPGRAGPAVASMLLALSTPVAPSDGDASVRSEG